MPTSERARDRGRIRGAELVRWIGREMRVARRSVGLSQQQVGTALGVSHSKIGRLERGEHRSVTLAFAASVASVLGHQLSVGMHPIGSPVRDRAHLALLERLRVRLHERLTWQTEVPMPTRGDLRALDALIGGDPWRVAVEAETRLYDEQVTERRARLKQRDAGADRLILLLLDTATNRRALRQSPEIGQRFPISARAALARLSDGNDPGGDAIILL